MRVLPRCRTVLAFGGVEWRRSVSLKKGKAGRREDVSDSRSELQNLNRDATRKAERRLT